MFDCSWKLIFPKISIVEEGLWDRDTFQKKIKENNV